MAIPPSGTITTDHVEAETGLSDFNSNRAEEMALIGKNIGDTIYFPTDFWGQSAHGIEFAHDPLVSSWYIPAFNSAVFQLASTGEITLGTLSFANPISTWHKDVPTNNTEFQKYYFRWSNLTTSGLFNVTPAEGTWGPGGDGTAATVSLVSMQWSAGFSNLTKTGTLEVATDAAGTNIVGSMNFQVTSSSSI